MNNLSVGFNGNNNEVHKMIAKISVDVRKQAEK
jgi:hypothetical protein